MKEVIMHSFEDDDAPVVIDQTRAYRWELADIEKRIDAAVRAGNTSALQELYGERKGLLDEIGGCVYLTKS